MHLPWIAKSIASADDFGLNCAALLGGGQMLRRAAIAGLGLMAASRALAQQREKPRVVGIVISAAPLADLTGPNRAIRFVRIVHRLRDLGWVEGQNLVIEWRTAEGRPERAPRIITELVDRGADVIIVSGANWLIEAARRTTSTVPLVAFFGAGQDPVALGQIASLTRPGGNLTGVVGVTDVELPRKRLQLLKELAPRTKRIAWLGTELQKRFHPPDVGPAGTQIVHAVAETLEEFDLAFALILREGCDAMHVGGSGVHYVQRLQIIAFAAQHRLPAVYPYREAVDDGGLMSYGPNIPHQYGQMVDQADQILRGARPADLPVQLPERFDLVINHRTARTLGLTIPPTLEAAAEVIE
jgi:putative ABC transport system substrate-binding protein